MVVTNQDTIVSRKQENWKENPHQDSETSWHGKAWENSCRESSDQFSIFWMTKTKTQWTTYGRKPNFPFPFFSLNKQQTGPTLDYYSVNFPKKIFRHTTFQLNSPSTISPKKIPQTQRDNLGRRGYPWSVSWLWGKEFEDDWCIRQKDKWRKEQSH